MKTRFKEHFENDPTPSREVVRRYCETLYDEDSDATLALVHYRGGEEEFRIGEEYAASPDPEDQKTGALILGQLGWSDRTFLTESVNILIDLLDDDDPSVIRDAALALGHRADPSAIPHLLKHVPHPDAGVRYGVVFGLMGHENERAIDALITLASDKDFDVRNWAVFGLGTQIEADTPTIRQALRQALTDPDHEIRGEALVGLARRNDPNIVQELINEWRYDEVSVLSLEAAEAIGDPRLLNRLKQFTEILSLDDDPKFTEQLHAAIGACNQRPDRSELSD